MVDDLASVDLDIAALEQGYRRPEGVGYSLDIVVGSKASQNKRLLGGAQTLSRRSQTGSPRGGLRGFAGRARSGGGTQDEAANATKRRTRIGLAIKRELLERAVRDDPDPEAFEEWLLQCGLTCAPESAGATLAMARAIFEEWRLTHSMNDFKSWLEQGAPSDDANEGSSSRPRNQQHESAKGRP